ncbi:MAG: aminotransferase class V-fold PLP-dependent enzyme [Sulfuricurvum sp.]|jgi:selenocysteine lyase/cysteine desulfurase|uniref:aminotransferase class V-fold PLP-dependent enzyme n=1 Tax=Sulfuricurvum sp. TaxID=2025608 RepID=UPI0025D6382D|nr:aminotransferase class V-fold PLP-dependent enzyme [Sulfuricurvum sp.]MCK9373856.1 aminotransferase class V-fold PLP-dependent enzyme [Sulfuricurvum sp.]
MHHLFRPLLEKRDKRTQILTNTIGIHKEYYFDYTASGLAYEPIEERIRTVLETYANTHSKEATMAARTDHYYRQAREHLKKLLELDDTFALIPCGSGATAALKRLQEILGLYIPPMTRIRYGNNLSQSNKRPLVIVGPYEHHSNEISYREAVCDTIRIGLDRKGLVDLEELETILRENVGREMIGAFCIASNVTGTITPYAEISALLRRYGALVCFDAAAYSPYGNIACELYDAMVFSPHKLLGGPGSCGLLAIRKNLFDIASPPTFSGGGTVSYVSRKNHYYIHEIEEREDAGTPGILQLIRAALAYQLRNEIGLEWIALSKKSFYRRFIQRLKTVPGAECYGCNDTENIGIVSFNIKDVDPYELCSVLSAEEGFQTRAGCSCAGPYGHDLLGLSDNQNLEERPGWLRVSLHFTHKNETIDKLVDAIQKWSNQLRNQSIARFTEGAL